MDVPMFTPGNNMAYFSSVPVVNVTVHEEDGAFWAYCPECPGWSAAAETWEAMFQLIADWHRSDDAPHRGFVAIKPGSGQA